MSTSSQKNQLIFSGTIFRSVILKKANTPENESPITKFSLIDKANVYFIFQNIQQKIIIL